MEFVKCVNQDWHMQGFTSDDKHEFMYWSFTNSVVKTTINGTVICQTRCYDHGHLGGMDYHDGKVYISFMADPSPWTYWGDWSAFYVYVYDAFDLKLLEKIEIPECKQYKKENMGGFRGIDGIAFGKAPGTNDIRMFVAVAVEAGAEYDKQYILQLDENYKVEKVHSIKTGNTIFGIQNLDYEADTGCFWITTYAKSQKTDPQDTLFCFNPELTEIVESYEYTTPYGFECLGNGEYYCSLQDGKNGSRSGVAYKVNKDFIKSNKILNDKILNPYIYSLLDKKN